MKKWRLLMMAVNTALLAGCATMKTGPGQETFGDELAFLKQHTDVVVLSAKSGDAQVIVTPALQGRVMTSTADGPGGLSFGWINHELIASGKTVEHINVFGGEDRFWIGPEGGQFSVFFEKGVPFDLEHWYTPAPVDTEPFELAFKAGNRARLKKDMTLKNYSDIVFKVRVLREIRIIEPKDAATELGVKLARSVRMVAFVSNNEMVNIGTQAWEKSTGLLSVWILGMFNPSPSTTVVVPFNAGPEDTLGPIVNDTYFGKVPSDRLRVGKNALFFSGDGMYRSKIGLSPQRAKNVLGSYDALNKVLTIVQYSKPDGATDYVNSMWELQKAPYKGDVVNSYNDGPAKPGAKPLGPFYELETSSPAAALLPGQAITHVSRTFHLQGRERDLDVVAKATLGVSLAEIENAFAR